MGRRTVLTPAFAAHGRHVLVKTDASILVDVEFRHHGGHLHQRVVRMHGTAQGRLKDPLRCGRVGLAFCVVLRWHLLVGRVALELELEHGLQLYISRGGSSQ